MMPDSSDSPDDNVKIFFSLYRFKIWQTKTCADCDIRYEGNKIRDVKPENINTVQVFTNNTLGVGEC